MRRLLTLAAAAAIAAVPGRASGQVAAPVHQILLYSYGYAPNPIRLEAGKAVTLQFVNRAGKRHDFTAEDFFANARFLAGSAEDGEIDLKAGESRSVTLIPAAGRYHVHCGRFFHKQLGMHGTILVQ